jgi:hypothetical protein
MEVKLHAPVVLPPGKEPEVPIDVGLDAVEKRKISSFGALVPSMCNAVHYSFFIFLYWSLHVSV